MLYTFMFPNFRSVFNFFFFMNEPQINKNRNNKRNFFTYGSLVCFIGANNNFIGMFVRSKIEIFQKYCNSVNVKTFESNYCNSVFRSYWPVGVKGKKRGKSVSTLEVIVSE